MAGVPIDLQGAPEVLLGQVPLAQVVADEPQVLIVGPHAGVEAGALVDPDRLLQEPGRLAPLPQVLVDQPEVVEGGDQPLVVIDAPEGRGRVLQPVDRLDGGTEPGAAVADRHTGLRHGAVIVGVAQHPVGVEPVAPRAPVPSDRRQRSRQLGGEMGPQARIAQAPRPGPRLGERPQRRREITALVVRVRQPQEDAATLDRGIRRQHRQGRRVLLDGAREVVDGQVQIADRLVLLHAFLGRRGMRRIGGDRSMHVRTLVVLPPCSAPRWFVPGAPGLATMRLVRATRRLPRVP